MIWIPELALILIVMLKQRNNLFLFNHELIDKLVEVIYILNLIFIFLIGIIS